MPQIRIVFDPELKVDAREVADLWVNDPQARELLAGPPEVRRDRPGTYLPSVVEFLVLPLAVNVASTILVEISTRLYRRYRPADRADVSVPDTSGDQDRTVVIERAETEEPGEGPQT